jgi:hypothetical protein
MKSTYLKILWECPEDNRIHEEVWERKNDGKLYEIFCLITKLIHRLGKLKD